MSNKRHKPEEIVTKLRQVEVLVGQGMARIDAIREIGVVEQTYYRWRKLYGGMGRVSRTRFPWTQNWLNRSVQGGPEHDR